MNRMTMKNDRGWAAEDMDAALTRLAKYEDLHETLEREQESIAADMMELRAAGKEKTVKYRELFAKKLQNVYALALFQARGL